MYLSPESFILKDLSPEKVECPRCDSPMDYKTDQPVFCKACNWPAGREEEPSTKRKANGAT